MSNFWFRLVMVAVGFGSLYPSTLRAQTDWTAFRGPSGQGISQAHGLPTEWTASDNVLWKVPLPGAGASSAIVFGDHIYLTCYTGYFVPGDSSGSTADLRRHLLCLDRASGRELWRKTVAAKLPEEERIRDHGFAASTPAADAHGVVCFFGKSGVIAWDHQGKQLWQTDVGSGTNGWGSSASPVLYKDSVYINASVESGTLQALDRHSGTKRWAVDGIKEAWNTPIIIEPVQGKPQLIMARQGKVLAFNPIDGVELWNCDTDIGWYMVPSIVEYRGVVYVLGGRSGTSSLAVRCDGSGDVTKTHRLWTSLKGSNVSSPVVADGYLYWVNDSQGIAYCAKIETGEIVYEERLNRAGQLYASALLADDKLYYLTREGKTYVIAAKPQFEQLAVNDLRDGGIFNASPAVDQKRLLIRSDKFLYCIGSK